MMSTVEKYSHNFNSNKLTKKITKQTQVSVDLHIINVEFHFTVLPNDYIHSIHFHRLLFLTKTKNNKNLNDFLTPITEKLI